MHFSEAMSFSFHALTNNLLCCGVNKNKQIVVIYDSFKMFSFKRTSMAVVQLSSIYDVDNQVQLKQIKEMYYFQETHLF